MINEPENLEERQTHSEKINKSILAQESSVESKQEVYIYW